MFEFILSWELTWAFENIAVYVFPVAEKGAFTKKDEQYYSGECNLMS